PARQVSQGQKAGGGQVPHFQHFSVRLAEGGCCADRHADERPLATRELPGFPTLPGYRYAGPVPARRRAVDRDTLEALPWLSAHELTDVLRRYAGNVCVADSDWPWPASWSAAPGWPSAWRGASRSWSASWHACTGSGPRERLEEQPEVEQARAALPPGG